MDSVRAVRVSSLAVVVAVASLFAAGCGNHSGAPTTVRSVAPAIVVAAVAPATVEPGGPAARAALSRAIAAQEQCSARLLETAGVVGTGATLGPAGEPRVLVLLARGGVAGIPASVGDTRVETLVVGKLEPWSLTGTYRPVPIGVSVGNNNECLPGTIGCVLVQGTREFLLSANHVFARQNRATIGEDIVQPSRPDADPACGPARPNAVVARLSDFQPVVYDGKTPNAMDAAIAEVILPPPDVSCATPGGFYGLPGEGVMEPAADLPVMKVGRTTELTRGAIKAVNVKVKLAFPAGVALFVGQFLTTPGFGAFGDSGSLVVTDDGTNRAVGMVIGGTNNGSAIASPIGPILERFGATICTR